MKDVEFLVWEVIKDSGMSLGGGNERIRDVLPIFGVRHHLFTLPIYMMGHQIAK